MRGCASSPAPDSGSLAPLIDRKQGRKRSRSGSCKREAPSPRKHPRSHENFIEVLNEMDNFKLGQKITRPEHSEGQYKNEETAPQKATPRQPTTFLSLPVELRVKIYKPLLDPRYPDILKRATLDSFCLGTRRQITNLVKMCPEISHDFMAIFLAETEFIIKPGPWEGMPGQGGVEPAWYYLSRLPPTYVGYIRSVKLQFRDTTNLFQLARCQSEGRFVGYIPGINFLRQLGQYGRLCKVMLSFECDERVDAKDIAFLDALKSVKTDHLTWIGHATTGCDGALGGKFGLPAGETGIVGSSRLKEEINNAMIRKAPLYGNRG